MTVRWISWLPGKCRSILRIREKASSVAQDLASKSQQRTIGVAVLDFDHDGWMDLAFTHTGRSPRITLWRNDHGKIFRAGKTS